VNAGLCTVANNLKDDIIAAENTVILVMIMKQIMYMKKCQTGFYVTLEIIQCHINL
jgi:hypothetical protein